MTKEVKTGMMAFIILVVAMAVFLFVRPKDWFGGNYFHMTASFSSVQGIKKGNEVRYAGVRVGEVSKISTEGNEGILEMRIKKDAQIPLDAEFTVSQSGVIGDYYVISAAVILTAVISGRGCVPEKRDRTVWIR